MLDALKGKKTYIIGFLGIIVAGLEATGKIDKATSEWLYGLLGSLGAMALRAGVQKAG